MENFKLNHWIIDVNSRVLSSQKANIVDSVFLTQLQLDLLIYLSQRPNQVVTNEQLIDALFSEQYINNHSNIEPQKQLSLRLEQTIEELSDRLGSEQQGVQFIEPVAHIGYRLLIVPEPVNRLQSKQGSINAYPLTSNNQKAKSNILSSAGLFALVVFIVLILTLAAIGLSYNEPPTAVTQKTNQTSNSQNIARVAVIPFSNNSEDSDDDYLGDGIAQELINSLANLTTINVLAHSSSFSYKGKRMNPYQIGSRLNAKYVLKGTVKRNKQQLSVTMQLLWVKTNIEVWSKTYKQPYRELLNLQHKMFIDISKQLKLPLSTKILVRNQQNSIDSRYGKGHMESYHNYLLGQSYAATPSATNLTRAINRFEQSVAHDPTFALAHARIAQLHLKQWSLNLIGQSNAKRKTLAALDKAFLLDPDLPEAHLTRGIFLAMQNKSQEAMKAYQQAIKLRPNYALALLQLAIEQHKQLDFENAEEAINKAITLDPNNPITQQVAAKNQLSMGELETGVKYLIKTIEQSSESAAVELTLAYWYSEFGYFDKSKQWAELAITKNQTDASAYIALANSEEDPQQRLMLLEQAKNKQQSENQFFNQIAETYYKHGDRIALHQYVRRNLYNDDKVLNNTRPEGSLMWAGIINMNAQQYLSAIKLFEKQLAQYKKRSENPTLQIKLANLLAYCYKKLNNNNKMMTMLKRSKRIQTDLIRNGLKTPTFVMEMVAYYVIAGEQTKAEQLLRNAMAKGWKLNRYIEHNPIFELLTSRQRYIIQ